MDQLRKSKRGHWSWRKVFGFLYRRCWIGFGWFRTGLFDSREPFLKWSWGFGGISQLWKSRWPKRPCKEFWRSCTCPLSKRREWIRTEETACWGHSRCSQCEPNPKQSRFRPKRKKAPDGIWDEQTRMKEPRDRCPPDNSRRPSFHFPEKLTSLQSHWLLCCCLEPLWPFPFWLSSLGPVVQKSHQVLIHDFEAVADRFGSFLVQFFHVPHESDPVL